MSHSAPSSTPLRLPVLSLVSVGMIFGLTYGLSTPLLTFSLLDHGYGPHLIAALAMMHGVGVLGIAPFLPRLAGWAGPRKVLLVALACTAVTLVLFPIVPSVWFWFPLRLVLGMATESMLIMSESWLNQSTDDSNRTRTMGLYSALMSSGFAAGPVLLTLVGRHGMAPFAICTVFVLAAFTLVSMPWMHAPRPERPAHSGLWRYIGLAPIAICVTLLMAMLEAASSAFLPLYALHMGWTERQATLLLSVMLLGAIVLQTPLGWLADRLKNPRALLIGLGTSSTLGALLWPAAISTPALAYPLLFIWDGLFAALYTVAMSVVGSRFSGGDLVSVYAATSLAWGLGSFAGPGMAGSSMAFSPASGLPLFVACACGLFTLLPVFLKNRA
ncbi:MFS transporter [Acetobacter sp. P1H12_c]|uniref:MFS transporter n=1 Tax=Acetobacter sp. P1H12_c TaxID=2762621 RepID=UPI00207B66CA|nr:MFS transporter [Acetobacter sp. P1H12_c]